MANVTGGGSIKEWNALNTANIAKVDVWMASTETQVNLKTKKVGVLLCEYLL